MQRFRTLVVLGFLLIASVANAQVIFSGGGPAIPNVDIWHVDVSSGERTRLFIGSYTAIGVDDANRRIFLGGGSERLFLWTYDSPNPPQLLGDVHLANGIEPGWDGFACANGRLFGVVGLSGDDLGFFEINLTSLVATPVPVIGAPATFPEGLAFNPSDGFFYGVEGTGAAPQGVLYRFDLLGGGATSVVATLPATSTTDVDGLAIGNGRAYLAGDTVQPFLVYDFASQAFLPPGVPTPLASPCWLSGADWAPSLDVKRHPQIYCEGKPGPQSCIPVLSWSGEVSASNAVPFPLKVGRLAPTATNGALFFSVVGPASTPFGGGNLCIAAPVLRTFAAAQATASSSCNRSLTTDFNLFIATGVNPALAAGQNAWLQFLWRDTGFTSPNNFGLSPGLRVLIKP